MWLSYFYFNKGSEYFSDQLLFVEAAGLTLMLD